MQIGIGIISDLIMAIPNLLVIGLFKRSRNRESRFQKLDKIIRENVSEKQSGNQSTETQKLQKTTWHSLLEKPSGLFTLLKDVNQVSTSGQTHPAQNPSNQTKPRRNSTLNSVVILFRKLDRWLIFPWWTKIIAYVLSALFVGVSITFIIFKGISFGDDSARKWLTSFVVSLLTSILVTQPLQIALVVVILVFIFRSKVLADYAQAYKDTAEKYDDEVELRGFNFPETIVSCTTQ